jgi:hypothetical protein
VVPENIVRFLEGAIVAMAGTRDGNLVPHAHRVTGWHIAPDRKTMTCLIPETFTKHLAPSLKDNGQLALTVCEVPSHETYQFKGDHVESRPVSGADLAVYERCRERYAARLGELYGLATETSQAYFPCPSVAVSFAVREIYLQTPGPGAGRRLVPGED